jgi:hypothetical protein
MNMSIKELEPGEGYLKHEKLKEEPRMCFKNWSPA